VEGIQNFLFPRRSGSMNQFEHDTTIMLLASVAAFGDTI
jgi:hypothetical protein